MQNLTDVYAGAIPERLPGTTLRDLSQISVGKSWAHIALEWAAIVAAIWLAEVLHRWYGYVAAIVWIGARQHALAILMHEGTHYRVAANRFWNDLLTEIFLAAPVFVSLRDYRDNHFAHHRHVNTHDDPDWTTKQNHDWAFPKNRRDLAWLLLQDVLLLRVPEQMTGLVLPLNLPPKSWRDFFSYHVWRLLYYVAGFAAIFYFGIGWKFLLYWVVPYFTWLKVIFRIRSIAEHFAIESDGIYTLTRTTYPRLWERLLIAPKNVNYHLDHHLYPSVPFYNLPALHQALLALPGFKEHAHVTPSYMGVLRECLPSSA